MADEDDFNFGDDDDDDDNDVFSLPSNAPVAYTSGAALAKPATTGPAPAKSAASTRASTTAQLLEQAQAAANRASTVPTTMDGIMAALGAKMDKASPRKGVAFAQGLVGGLTNAHAAMKKNDGKEVFDRLIKLGTLSAKVDADDRKNGLAERRTSAYERSVDKIGSGGHGRRGRDPIQVQRDIEYIMSKNQWQKILEEDDGRSPTDLRKLPLERRRELEQKRDADRKKLEDMTNRGPVAQEPLPPQQNPGN